MCHVLPKGEVGAWNRFMPCSKIFLLTVPRRYFFCGSFVLFLFLFVMLSCASNREFVAFPLVSWVRFGT